VVLKRIEVLYEDEYCLVLNKPAGLAVQGGKGVGVSLDGILAVHYRGDRPLLVHRLDKDTSGAILVAKNRDAAARFSRLLGEGRAAPGGIAAISGKNSTGGDAGGVTKRYLAVSAGSLPGPEGTISADLEIKGSVKKSETRYRVLAAVTGPPVFSLLELELGTGRMHQIRRHLALAGAPIPGDDKYGDFTLNKRLRKTMNLRRLLLHAAQIIIPPAYGFSLNVRAPLPDYFRVFLEQTGLDAGGGAYQ
jgi:23S rRNA pseudouridine955/2504/2580 synthase